MANVAPKTPAQRKREERARKAAQGVVTVSVEVPESHRDWLNRTAASLRSGGEPPDLTVTLEPVQVVEIENPVPVTGEVRIERVYLPSIPITKYRTSWRLMFVVAIAAATAGWWLHDSGLLPNPTPRCESEVGTDPSGRRYCWLK